jgi:frataxin-like iron-binding protein CyaY
MNNLTVIVDTLLTQKHQPYAIELQIQQLKTQISHISQVDEGGADIELTPEGDIMTVKSNTDYQIILKFQAPTELIFLTCSFDHSRV